MPHPLVSGFHQLVASGKTGFLIGQDGKEVRPENGYAVGVKRLANIEEAVGSECLIGYWVSPEGDPHVDVVRVFAGKATAMVAAISRCELAIYDFAHDAIIGIGKNGL